MRVSSTIAFIAPLILVAGCTNYNQRHAGYDTSPVYSGDTVSTSSTVSTGPFINNADRALADSVRKQFNRYGNLSTLSPYIQVSAHDGAVTLTGSVPSESDRRMVDAMVENVPGVKTVYDQMKVASFRADTALDQADNLVNRIRQSLRNQTTVASLVPNVQIAENNGSVTLSGTVPREEDRTLIESVVRNTPGVLIVNDNLGVQLAPTGRTAPGGGDMFNLNVQGTTDADRLSAQRVLDGLRSDTILASLLPKVDIKISGGRVTLQGTVQNEQQERAIAAAVQRAAGVGNVDDQLQVQTIR